MLKHGMTRDRPEGPLFVGIFKPFIYMISYGESMVSRMFKRFGEWMFVRSTHGINRSTGGHEYWQASGEIL